MTPTTILIAANIVFYVVTSILGWNFVYTDKSVLALLGQFNFLVLNEGWYWQLFTAMFVHVNILHLMGNMFFLYIFGLAVERHFTNSEYVFIYFASGLLGNILSLSMGPFSISAGASGALFGLLGAHIIYSRKVEGGSIAGALIFCLFFFMFSIGANVNILAHFGGLVAGMAAGFLKPQVGAE